MVASRDPREHLTNEERLRQELLDAACAAYRHTVLIRKLLDTENRDNVLQVTVALKHLLHFTCNAVVLFADDTRLQNPGV